ncbi:putative MFS transporter [metagenome]|uniref:Putative MFS transporter n=1 Tax=metagenome TaxID=256318 RepID=A0A2P2C408_9ZZZZ
MSTLAALTAPPVLRSFALSFVARLPLTVIGVLVLLRTRELGFSYALAGVAAGAFTLGMSAGAPLVGRLVDRHGQLSVLCTTSLIAGAAISVFALAPADSPLLIVALAGLVGFAQPPVSACVRVLWGRLLSERERDAMFAVDISAQGIAFIIGPVTMLWLASTAGAVTALFATGILIVVGTMAFALDPVGRRHMGTSPTRIHSGPAAIAYPGVRTILAITAAVGVSFGAVEVGIVAAAERHQDVPLVVLLGAWSVGALVGGPLWGLRGGSGRHIRDALLLISGLVACTATLAIPSSGWWVAAGLVLFGLLVTPFVTLLYTMLASAAPPEALTEAYSWEVTGMTGGIALGTAAGGVCISASGLAGAFLLAGAAMLVSGVVLGLRIPTLRRD